MNIATLLAQDSMNNVPNVPMPSSGSIIAAMAVPLAIVLILSLIVIVAMWKIFTKAGKPGWASIIPIYNVIVMLEIAGKPIWWIVLFFIPFVNFVVAIIVVIELARRFGQGVGFALGMIFLPIIFYPILGFGSARYQGAPAM